MKAFATLACAAAMSVVASTRNARACGACRGAGGAGGALTAADERWNLTLGAVGRTEIGSWDWSGRSHGQPSGVAAQDLVGQLSVGVRVIRPLEIALLGGAGVSHLQAPGLDDVGGGITDTTLRARWDVLAEDPSQPARPAASTWFAISAPTGQATAPSYGSTAGVVGAFGLGTWEFALGADVRRTFAMQWQPFVALQGALRAPDGSQGYARALGPRGLVRAGVTFFANDVFAFSALSEWAIEGDLSARDQLIDGSWQQRTSTGFAASAHLDNGMRLSLSTFADVPIPGLGRNAEATFRLGFTIGYSGVNEAWRRCPIETRGHIASRAARRGRDG